MRHGEDLYFCHFWGERKGDLESFCSLLEECVSGRSDPRWAPDPVPFELGVHGGNKQWNFFLAALSPCCPHVLVDPWWSCQALFPLPGTPAMTSSVPTGVEGRAEGSGGAYGPGRRQ